MTAVDASTRLTLRDSPPPADTEASIMRTSHFAGPTTLYSKVLRGPLVLTTCACMIEATDGQRHSSFKVLPLLKVLGDFTKADTEVHTR